VVFKNDYSEWLPSINAAYDMTDEIIIRAAASRGLTRPGAFQLAPAVNLTVETSSGTAGNPDLAPLISSNYEVGGEWYFTEASLVGFTAFKKDISNFIYTTTVSKEINGVQIDQLSTPVNGGNAAIDGVEFQLQHDFGNGFGVSFNYTYTDVADVIVTEAATVSDEDGNISGATLADRTIKLPNASKDSYNLGAFYENEQFSARVNYNYRSEYFLAQTEFGNRYREAQSNVDAQLSWNVTDYMTVKLEALNLTNEVWENYYERETDGTQVGGTQSSNGRRYYLGASFNF
jgi:iron complex outermembrane receptor protein